VVDNRFTRGKRFLTPSFRARVFAALVGVSATTCLIIGVVLYYFAENRLVDEEERSLIQRSQLANASAGEFLEGLRNPETGTFQAPETYVEELVQAVASPTGLGVLYVAPDGTPLAARQGSGESPNPEELYRQLGLTREMVERAEQSTQGEGRIYPRDGWPRHITVWPLQASDGVMRGAVVYYAPQEDLNQTLAFLRFGILGAIGTSILLAGLASLLLTRQITQPLSLTRDAAIRVASGDYSVVPVQSRDELGEVAAAFNYMAQEIERNVREIQEQKSRLEAVLEASPEAVVAIDPQERVTMANPAAARMLNISPKQLGRRFGENGVPNGVIECLRLASETGAAVREVESGGRVYWAYAAKMARLAGEDERPGVILAVRDITEYRSLERAKTAFVSDLSHEIRTPLTTIQSAIGIVAGAGERLSQAERRSLQLAEQELNRIRGMVEELLTLAQMDSQQYSLELGPTDLEQVVLDAVESIRSKAERFGATIELDLDAGEHTCPGDSRKLYQVFLNLLDNAVKYSDAGAHVRVSITEEDENAVVRVQDTGLGIPEEDLPQLFERFYRVDKARSRASGGSGLGLSIVREIVELHGGEVGVESKLGVGSTFTVRLPKFPAARPADYAR
jgi:PAS domain S-box-containing protein